MFLNEAWGKGFSVLGSCTGFQILCESRLLPGVLVRNESRRFIDRWVDLKLVNRTRWTAKGQAKLRLPIAHGEGRFFLPEDGLKKLFDSEQVWLSYADNPNGSLRDIAGVANATKNVCGLMPHPERALFDWMGGEDGREIMGSLLS